MMIEQKKFKNYFPDLLRSNLLPSLLRGLDGAVTFFPPAMAGLSLFLPLTNGWTSVNEWTV